MKLYFAPGACSLAVRILIHELGLSSEFEKVDLKTKITENGTNYLTINPKGTVPTLILDNGEKLTENAVIQTYLADTNNATQLLPPVNDFARYRVLEWLNFISTDIHKGFGPFFLPNVPAEVKEEIFKPALKTKFKYINNAIKENKFLYGTQLTLPDIYLFVMLSWFSHLGFEINEFPNLSRYFSELKKRKSIVLALEEEKKSK